MVNSGRSASLPDPTSVAASVALEEYLGGLEPAVRQRGQAYFRSGAVTEVRTMANLVTASVRGSFDYRTVLTWEDRRWTSHCSCPVGSDCKHVFALGQAWLAPLGRAGAARAAGGGSAPPPPRVAQFMAAVAEQAPRSTPLQRERLARHLHALVDALHHAAQHQPWFGDRVAAALAALVSPTFPQHRLYDLAAQLHQTVFAEGVPADLLDVWRSVAAALEDAADRLPEWTAPFTDTTAAHRTIANHRRAALVREWDRRFRSLAEAPPPDVAAAPQPPLLLALDLGVPKTAWRQRESADAPWRTLNADQMRQLVQTPDPALLQRLTPASLALFTLWQLHARHHTRVIPRLGEREDRAFLAAALAHPLARELVLGPGGQPITAAPERVVWTFRDHPDDPALVLVQLQLDNGEPLPGPAVFLEGDDPAYFAGGRLYRGLPPLHPTKVNAGSAEMPREVLALPAARSVAARHRMTLPDTGAVVSSLRTEALTPQLRLSLLDQEFRVVLRAELLARAPDGAVRQIYLAQRWETDHPAAQPPDDPLWVLADTSRLAPASTHFATFGFNCGLLPDPTGTAWHLLVELRELPGVMDALVPWLKGFPPGVELDLSPELAPLLEDPTAASWVADLSEIGGSRDWFDLSLRLKPEDTKLTAEDLKMLLAARGRWTLLPSGQVRRLAAALDPGLESALDQVGVDPTQLTATSQAQHLRLHTLQLAERELGRRLPAATQARLSARAEALAQLPAPPVPASLHATLRPYQAEGFAVLARWSQLGLGGLLCDDMGLGKTVQALAWLLWLESQQPPERPLRVLVVCPKSVAPNWVRETERFAPSLRARALERKAGPPPATGADAVHVLVINYTQLRLQAETLQQQNWTAVILDEAQAIKNPSAQTSQVARTLRAEHRLILTGTPIENRLLDLWSLCAFALPGLLGSQAGFNRLYSDKIDAAAARSRLAARVRPFLLRRTKAQVAADLPPRIEEDLLIDLEPTQRRRYDAELKHARAQLLGVSTDRALDAVRFNVLQSLLRLRQICCDPRLLDPRASSGESAKLDALLDLIEPLAAEGHRVLVFSQFTSVLELLAPALDEKGIAYLTITGQTENRQELVDTFQAADGPPVFLLSLKAAGAGLNLTAASYVVLYDPWWNPAVEAQAIDRTHRIGQTAKVIAYRLLARGTIEEKIRALQREKAEVAHAIIGDETTSAAPPLDLATLRDLLDVPS